MTHYVMAHGKRIEVETLNAGAKPKIKPEDRLIGCPVSWLRRVLPVVKSPKQLAVAIWLWRRRVICKNSYTFSVPNDELKRLKVSRQIKYRTLARLEAAGVIAIERKEKEALVVTILPVSKEESADHD
jgi:hypothetical protein